MRTDVLASYLIGAEYFKHPGTQYGEKD